MVVRRSSVRVGYLAFCLVYLLAAQSRAQETEEAVPADQAFVNRFWQADSEASRMALSEELLLSQPDPAALFELLKRGQSTRIRSPLASMCWREPTAPGQNSPT